MSSRWLYSAPGFPASVVSALAADSRRADSWISIERPGLTTRYQSLAQRLRSGTNGRMVTLNIASWGKQLSEISDAPALFYWQPATLVRRDASPCRGHCLIKTSFSLCAFRHRYVNHPALPDSNHRWHRASINCACAMHERQSSDASLQVVVRWPKLHVKL